jgi:cytochrome c553
VGNWFSGSNCSGWKRVALMALVVVLVAIVISGIGVYRMAEVRLTRQYDTGPVPSLAGGDSARGAHLVTTVSICTRCHGPDLGGQIMVDNPVFRLAAPNLTRGIGGRPASWSEADWNRAIRHGVGGRGNPLVVMPAEVYAAMSDQDLRAVVAYLRSIRPVDRDVGRTTFKPFGRILVATGAFDEISAEKIDHGQRQPEHAAPDDGAYLSTIAGCTYCHQPGFGGNTKPKGPPDAPPIPAINTLAQRGWTLADFSLAVRHGKRPDGRALSKSMPWSSYTGMTDTEVTALWLETQRHGVPARAAGR